MKLLQTTTTEIYTQLLIEELPKAFLESIARHSGISEGQLISSAHRLFPSSVGNTEQHRLLCLEIIHWLRNNGDIVSCGNQHYLALPSHILEISNENEKSIFKICGNPRFDEQISSAIQTIGCNVETRYVTKEIRVWDDVGTFSAKVGWARVISIDHHVLGELKKILHEIRVPIIKLDGITESLPSITNLFAPSISAYQTIGPSSGIWQIYSPELPNICRWKNVERCNLRESGIVHWQPNDDWRGKESERFFYYNGGQYLADLSPTIACLWMYKKDHEVGNPKRIWWHDNIIWVPTELPHAHVIWLHLISTKWIEQMNGDLQEITLRRESSSPALLLQKTLGVEVINHPPRL